MIHLEVNVRTELPKLAWIVQLDRKQGVVSADVGINVEFSDNALIDGIWAGDFEEFDFDRAQHVFGTGVRVRGNVVSFVTSSALVDRVYFVEQEETVHASNSLPLLLHHSGARLKRTVSHWRHSSAVGAGISAQPVALDDIDGRGRWFMMVAGQAKFGRDGGFTFEPHGRPENFLDYTQYEHAMQAEIENLFRNLRHRLRTRRLSTYSTASKGYDSACVTALVAQHGIDGCFSSRQSNSLLATFGDDDGSPIARHFGLTPLILFEATGEEETLFRASNCYPPELSFASALRNEAKDCVLFSGFFGDSAWGLDSVRHSQDVRWPLPSGVSLAEPRLHAGVIHVPLPFLFARSLESLRRISQSVEMAPWRLGTDYDRPIPRRMLESAGVPRALFGQRKRAIVNSGLLPAAREARQHFLEWAEAARISSRRQLQWHYLLNHYSYPMRAVLGRAGLASTKPVAFMDHIDTRSLMMSWAVESAMAFYGSYVFEALPVPR